MMTLPSPGPIINNDQASEEEDEERNCSGEGSYFNQGVCKAIQG